ncbi:MAG: protein-disulfide reductase DsbD [Gammaproteobacteria bacterium]
MAASLARLIVLVLALVPGLAAAGLLDALDGGGEPRREFLPPDQAFVFDHDVDADGKLALHWRIAPDYYLYRDKFKLEALTPGSTISMPALPPGETKDDPEFGPVQIYREDIAFDAPVGYAAGPTEIRVSWQGCAEDGICYPPIKKVLSLVAPAAAAAAPAMPATPAVAAADLSETDTIAADLAGHGLTGVVASFLGFGLLLALTPCVFPMIPILSGIIVGSRERIGSLRGFVLSAVYVLAMAGTYAVAGLAAGLFGRNLQAAFQHPAVLIGTAALFVALALSMFGFFALQLPPAWQTRLERSSRAGHGGSLPGVALMGGLSALIVGPCVAPPLAGALIYLARQGDPMTGGLALFALGLGMGVPLLVVGASAGRLLPRAGQWLERIKYAFGVISLGMAIWFLSRLLPPPLTLALWAMLLIGAAMFLGALEPLHDAATGWQRLWKSVGLAFLCYGAVLIVGAAAGADDVFRPLAPLTAASDPRPVEREQAFTSVKDVPALEQALAAAEAAGKPALLDFYADWCIECKHLERNTFADPEVRTALASFALLRADVTANDAADRALLARFELFGPPAVLLFDDARRELRPHRLIGYAGPADFLGRLRRAYGE